MIGSLVVGSSVVYCALQYLAAQVLGDSHLHSCAAGFSCVLFGLKVIMQSTSPPSHRLFGIPIHMAYWSELVWISIISPNVSFVGHLAGWPRYLFRSFLCILIISNYLCWSKTDWLILELPAIESQNSWDNEYGRGEPNPDYHSRLSWKLWLSLSCSPSPAEVFRCYSAVHDCLNTCWYSFST